MEHKNAEDSGNIRNYLNSFSAFMQFSLFSGKPFVQMLENCRFSFISHQHINQHVAEDKRRLFKSNSTILKHFTVLGEEFINANCNKPDKR